jgi:O-antigen ligase
LGLVLLKGREPRAVPLPTQPDTVQWSFLLFIGSIGAELSYLTGLLGILFFAIYIYHHNPFFNRRSFPPVTAIMVWFVIYVAIYALNGFFLPAEFLREFLVRLFTLIQLVILLWIASDIMQDEKMATRALLAYSIAAMILSLGLVFSLRAFGITGQTGSERASLESMNANSLAYVTALAVVALLGVWLKRSHKGVVESAWIFASMIVLSFATVYTGSRGGVVMLMLGLSVYLVPYWKNRWRMSTAIIAVIAMTGLAYVAAKTPAFSERWRAYSEQGNTSGRDRIFEAALDMFSERPIIGWQPVEFRYELGRRTGERSEKDAHNTFLHLFMEVGSVGAVPFLIGLWLCGKGAWRARNRNMGLLPLALLVASLAGSMTSTSIYRKAQWFVLAVTAAASTEGRRRGVSRVEPPVENGARRVHRRLKPPNVRQAATAISQRTKRSHLSRNP